MDTLKHISPFITYMSTALGLTSYVLSSLRGKYKSATPSREVQGNVSGGRRTALVVFSGLAIFSLCTTWYHMISFLRFSYQTWRQADEARQSLSTSLALVAWLKDSELFDEAWTAVCTTQARLWWSRPIFFFTAAMSILISRESYARKTSTALWSFMVLGQMVAISFALNLFFLDVIIDGLRGLPTTTSKPKVTWHVGSAAILLISLATTLASVSYIPLTVGTPKFLINLAIPHIALFIPIFLPLWAQRRRTGKAPGVSSSPFPSKVWSALPFSILVASCLVHLPVGSHSIPRFASAYKTLYEHPAVSSVGWDVINCWVSFTAWGIWRVFGDAQSSPLRKRVD